MPGYRCLPLMTLLFTGTAASRMPLDFAPARRVLEEAVRDRVFPGCAVAVGTHDKILWLEGIGRLDHEGGPPARPDTLYDLASLTKVVGTTTVLARLVHQDRISITTPVVKLIPEMAGEAWQEVTIKHLLTHTAGLPAWRPLFRDYQGHAQIIAQAISTPLQSPPGALERYSDLGFLILGEAVTRSTRKPLPALELELVFAALEMKDTCRNPTAALFQRTAPTEIRAPGPGQPPVPTRGVVHDENALAAGGDAGHAGVFSTAEDLARFAREMLRAWRGESSFLPQSVAQLFVTRANVVEGSSRALGWDTPSGQSSAGNLLGPRSFGHTGFTGTSLWIDPDRDLYLVLLSNRVHPTREGTKISGVRRQLADTVVLCVEKRIARL